MLYDESGPESTSNETVRRITLVLQEPSLGEHQDIERFFQGPGRKQYIQE
jgi:hypothetical protein